MNGQSSRKDMNINLCVFQYLMVCVCISDLMLTVMETSNFTPSVYSVHALTLLAEVSLPLLKAPPTGPAP